MNTKDLVGSVCAICNFFNEKTKAEEPVKTLRNSGSLISMSRLGATVGLLEKHGLASL
jgi:hypothetical protein